MSEKTTRKPVLKPIKRTNKTKEELTMELERQTMIKFWTDIKAVEDKYGFKVRAYVQSDFRGVIPFVTAEKIEKKTI